MQETAQYFEKQFFYKQILDFNCPSKILCLTSKLRNFVKITGPYNPWHQVVQEQYARGTKLWQQDWRADPKFLAWNQVTRAKHMWNQVARARSHCP